MDAQSLAALASVPSALAVIIAVRLFLNHLNEQSAKFMRHLEEQAQENRLMLTNHLSTSIAVQAETARNLGVLATAIAVMKESNEQGMAKTMEFARDSMTQLIREIGRQPSKPD